MENTPQSAIPSPDPVEDPPLPLPDAGEAVMQDFVFGGIEADTERLLESERARWNGIRHEYAISPLDPLPGQPVTISVTVGPDLPADRVTAYVTIDGSQAQGRAGIAGNGFAVELERVEIRWEALIWGYVEVWRGDIPLQPQGTLVHYIIEAWSSVDPALSAWSREQNIDRTLSVRTSYAYHVDRDHVPAWAHEAVVYQIFVDRFRDHRRSDAEHVPLHGDDLGKFWGGTLRGLIEQLDYIVALGVNTIWLTPVFATPSYHGYDTTDYRNVDPRFGTNDDLRELVQQGHTRGLRVLLDLVVNHVAIDFAPFQQALADPEHEARRWFSFGEEYSHGYRTFFDVASMPQLNLDEPAAREAIVDVARYWLRDFDVDGFRLDYAAGPSHAFWSTFRRECRATKPDCWLFGEVTRTGQILRAYTGRLDGCLDFAFARAVRRLCTQPGASLTTFVTDITRSRDYFGPDFSHPSFLDNHDMNRFLWVAKGDKQTLRLAAGLLFGLGGAPVLYYGTEVGLSQPRPKAPHMEEARHPMLWGKAQDGELLVFFRRWIAARRTHRALVYGTIDTLLLDEQHSLWLVQREHEGERLLLAINCGRAAQEITLPSGAFSDLEGQEVRGNILLPERSVILLV